MKEGNLLRVWSKVFRDPKYLILGIIAALLFYGLNVLILNWSSLVIFSKTLGFFGVLKLFLSMSIGFVGTIKGHSFFSILILSIMFGILISLIGFKLGAKDVRSKGVGVFGWVGVFLGALVPGCAACGVGLISVLGLGVAVASLPFAGFEISVLAIVLLGFTIYKTSKDLTMCNSCKIKLRSQEM